MKTAFHIGCSSFNNPYWKGIFYPQALPRSQWFDYYCKHFKTYELNATFYRFPTVKTLKSWYDKSPEDFQFSVKAPKLITHLKKFTDCQTEMGAFYDICREGLHHKLSNILFQLPPSYAYSPEKLSQIVGFLNPDFKNVIEFRNDSWWNESVYEVLRKHAIAFCSVSYPGLPESIIKTTETVYIRLHGQPKLFYSGYDHEKLQHLIVSVKEQEEIADCFIYFNNTAGIEGIQNALAMQSIVKSQ